MTKTAEMSDWLYYIHAGSTVETRSPTYTQTMAGTCALTCTLEFFHDQSNTWVDNSAWSTSAFDTSSGSLSVLITDPTTYKPFLE